MNKKVNFHTHTYRCKHAIGTEEDYLIEAINKNLTHLGISDHAPYPDDRLGLRMEYKELPEYISTVENLKEKYKNKIKLYCGLEIEYDPNSYDYYKYLLNELHIDYLALGQHVFTHNGEFCNSFELTSTDEYISYANTIVEAFSTGFFKFLCHPDLVFLNDFPWDDNCEKACDIIIEGAKKYNMILEVNGNGVRRGIKEFCDGERYHYPHENFWKKVNKNNLRVIINSDCHNPKDLWDENMDKAYEFANKLDLNLVYDIF